MADALQITKMGKLRIYMASGEALLPTSFLWKAFPKSKYLKILQEAKVSGILNAHVFRTHAAVQQSGNISHYTIDSDTSGLTLCVEPVDTKEKLQAF